LLPTEIETKLDQSDIVVPGTGNSFFAIVSYAKEHLGIPDTRIDGALFQVGSKIRIVLAISPPKDSEQPDDQVTLDGAPVAIEDLIMQAALQLMRQVDPLKYALYLYYYHGDEDGAIDMIKATLDNQPEADETKVWTYYLWGKFLSADGLYSSAADKYASSINIDPGFALSYNGLGNIYYHLAYNNFNAGGGSAETRQYLLMASREYSSAIRKDPTMSDCYYNLGLVSDFLGIFEPTRDHLASAIANFRTSVRLDPGDGDAYDALGVDLSRMATEFDQHQGWSGESQSDTDGAVASLKRAVEVDTGDPEPYFQLSLALRDAGKLSTEDERTKRLARESDAAFCDGLYAFEHQAAPSRGGQCDKELLNSDVTRVQPLCAVSGISCEAYLLPN
jgi:tetratricopeptide (TPR) repeat protein